MGKAVVACNSAYRALPVTAHYFARWLAAAGFDVLFVSAPLSPLHILNMRDPRVAKRFEAWRRGVQVETGRISSLVPLAAVTPRDFWPLNAPALYRNWPAVSVPPLEKTIRGWANGRVDYLYLEAPVFLPLLGLARRSIYRLPDMLGSFHAQAAPILRVAAEIAQAADLTVYAAESYAEQVESLRPRASECLPNGVELGAFAGVQTGEPPDLAALPKPRIVFMGEVGARIDEALLARLAAELPNASIVILGPAYDRSQGRRTTPLGKAPNVHFLGTKPYQQLASYLVACDLGIVPFRFDPADKFIAHSNPLKVHQYLACGLPVVATWTPALESVRAPIRLARSGDEFLTQVKLCLETDEASAHAGRRDYAAAHSFEARLEGLFRKRPEYDPRNLLA